MRAATTLAKTASAAGWTYTEVARELGVSRQAVHEKYSR